MGRGTPLSIPHHLVAFFGYSPLVACGHSLGNSNLAPRSHFEKSAPIIETNRLNNKYRASATLC